MNSADIRVIALAPRSIACRKGGRVSVPGVYGGVLDKFRVGAFTEKGLTLKTGQIHVQKYTRPPLKLIEEGKIDTTFLISHREPLERAAEMYKHWHDDQDVFTKIVLKTPAARDFVAASEERQREPA